MTGAIGCKIKVTPTVILEPFEAEIVGISKYKNYVLVEHPQGWPFKNCPNDALPGHNIKPDTKVFFVAPGSYQVIK